jgi:chromosomal replication initiation ATPase DnaA
VLEHLKAEIDAEEYRRWFSASSYASDSGDIISVWVPSTADARQISQNFTEQIRRILGSLGRRDTHVRFLATGYSDEEDDYEE